VLAKSLQIHREFSLFLNYSLVVHPVEVPLFAKFVPGALRFLRDFLHLGQLMPQALHLVGLNAVQLPIARAKRDHLDNY